MTDATRDALPQTTATPPMSARARAECVKMLLEDITANAAQSARYANQVPVYTCAEDLPLVTINLNKARLYLNAALQSNRALRELLEPPPEISEAAKDRLHTIDKTGGAQ